MSRARWNSQTTDGNHWSEMHKVGKAGCRLSHAACDALPRDSGGFLSPCLPLGNGDLF